LCRAVQRARLKPELAQEWPRQEVAHASAP
jgi:hypothetical protein